MKIAPLIAIVSMVAAAPSFAASIFSSSLGAADGGATDRIITSSSGAALTSGFAVTGTFSITDAEVSNLILNNNFQQLFASISAIGSDNFSGAATNDYLGFGVAGSYVINAPTVDPTSYIGKTVYTLLSSSATTPGGAGLEYAVIAFGAPITADPTSPPVPNSYSFAAGAGTLLFGKGDGTIASTDLGSNSVGTIALQPVPETSTAILGLLGVAGLVRRRR